MCYFLEHGNIYILDGNTLLDDGNIRQGFSLRGLKLSGDEIFEKSIPLR